MVETLPSDDRVPFKDSEQAVQEPYEEKIKIQNSSRFDQEKSICLGRVKTSSIKRTKVMVQKT